MSDNQSNLEIKKHLEELGLYEPGMTMNDMKTVYTTVNKSKESASLEKDFRQLLEQTDENCLNIHNLTQCSPGSSDTILQDDEKMGNSQSNAVVREKKNEEQLNSSMGTEAQFNDTDSITYTRTSTPVKPLKRNNTRNNDNIDVFIPTASIYKPLELRVPHKNRIPSAIFYHPAVLKLPVDKRAMLIYKSNVIQIEKYEATRRTGINNVPWGEPIKPAQAKHFNGDLCADAVPWVEEIRAAGVEDGQGKENNGWNKEENKPKRQVKRKNYKEIYSSDDDDKDFVTKNNKKNKVSNGAVTRANTRSHAAENKRNTSPKKYNLSLTKPNVSNRTDKIFDELKKQDVAKARQQKSKQPEVEAYNGSSDDDIFSTGQHTTTTVEVHGTGQTDNRTTTTRQNKLAETEQQNTSMKTIPAKNFYERNSREKAPHISNNNEERKTECPICRLPFAMSVIEDHASTCTQFEEEGEISEPFCDICEKRIPLTVDMQAHRQQCIKFICEQSEEAPKRDTNDNKVAGQMCSICDKYFMNGTDMNKHASECIKSITRK